jgi:Domain of unknown function (DUF5658)
VPPARNYRRPRRGRAFWLLLGLFAILQVADVVTTNCVLKIPGAIEANPVMAAAQHSLGPWWWLPKAAITLWFVLVASGSRRRWPLVCAVLLCAVVVAINLANVARASNAALAQQAPVSRSLQVAAKHLSGPHARFARRDNAMTP